MDYGLKDIDHKIYRLMSVMNILSQKLKGFKKMEMYHIYYYMVELVAAKPHLLKLLLIMLSVIIYILMRRMNEI